MAKNEETSLVKYADTSLFPALTVPAEELAELLSENLGGAGLTPFSLQRIKVPSGGDTYWRVPDPEKGMVPQESITGIILHNQYARGYWESAYGAGDGGPPSCTSYALNSEGIGMPGGACAVCPYNQFGSAENGSGKACSEKRFLFLLSPGDFLPIVIQGPATSLKSIFNYGMELTRKGLRLHQVVTSFTLESEKHGGYDTSVIKLSVSDRLSPDDAASVAQLRESMVPQFQQVARTVAEEGFLNDE
jgi:hypothetical protein